MDQQNAAGGEQQAPAGRARFEWDRQVATRQSVLAGGLVAIFGMPAWSLFDFVLAPDDAWQFTTIRLVATALIAIAWLMLFTRLGRRHPDWVGLAVIAPVQLAIAAMLVQLDSNHAAYALGMSLPIYASGFLLVWRLRFTSALIGISILALAVGWLVASNPASAAEIATAGFYLLTASAIAVVGQLVRDGAAWREFETKSELEAEQVRTRELVAKLDRLSHEDSLTELANRRAWDEAIARECAQLDRSDGTRTLSVVLCDVDRLKEINDSLGHAVGDIVLRGVAGLLRRRIRAADLVARIGGDEFAILAVDSNEVEAATLAEDLRSLVAEEVLGGPALGGVTVSIGVASWDGADDSPEALMLRADRRLYAAKAHRNVICAGDPIEAGESDERTREAGGRFR